MINQRALVIATAIGTVAQLAMVVAGHTNPAVAATYAVGGMGFSLLAGIIYAWLARANASTLGALASGGALAGGICAFLGILVSRILGDVPTSLLLLGTISSVVTGAIGGALGKLFARKSGAAAALIVLAAGSMVSASAGAQAIISTKDFAWLAGRWEGTMSSGAVGVADVTFAPPVAGLITGMMRLVADEKVLVVELISMTDSPRGVEMRFRHFSNALEAYEPTFKQSMRLTSNDAGNAVFENDVPYDKALMSTQPRITIFERHDDNSFTGRSNIINDAGQPAIVEVRYQRVGRRPVR